MNRRRKTCAWVLGSLAGLTAAAAVLHIPLARSLGAGCPFDAQAGDVTPGEIEGQRKRAATWIRGEVPATATYALDFQLEVSTRQAVRTWAEDRGGTCTEGQDLRGLSCTGIDSTPHGSGTLHADFGAADELVAMAWQSRTERLEDARLRMEEVRGTLEAMVGIPTEERGVAALGELAAGKLRQARIEYRRSNYYASVSATHLGDGQFVLAEVYRAL